jgi:UDPglucose--hexose-1-phosphate uridylyltransferase
LVEERTDLSESCITEIVREEVGEVFVRVLEDAGVYKRTSDGKQAFRRFVTELGLVN